MKSLLKKITNFLKSDCGPTAVEYAVMLALIIVVCIGSVAFVGLQTNNSIEHSNAELKAKLGL